MQQWFTLIDVKNNQKKLSKDAKKGKQTGLDIHNEIKIITSNEECFGLWKDFIAAHNEGELVDPNVYPPRKITC